MFNCKEIKYEYYSNRQIWVLLMMASVAISCSDPNPLDSYTRCSVRKNGNG